jgi:antitoxin component YwqK of YwqJK toxin-antitoxin module
MNSKYEREFVNTSYYKNKKNLNKLPDDILNKVIKNSSYEDSININYLDRDFNSRYPKSYIQSKSSFIEPHGTIRTYYDKNKTKLKSIAQYRNGAQHGQYLEYYKLKNGETDLKLKEKSNYKDGNLEGKYKEYYETGDLKTFIIQKDDFMLKEISYSEDGKKERETVYDDENYGEITKNYTDENDKIVRYSNPDSPPHRTEMWKNGKISYLWEGPYEEYGIITEYYPNGKIKEKGEFSERKKVGIWKTYWKNGNIKTIKDGEYNGDNLYEGICLTYSQDGILEKIEEVSDGSYILNNELDYDYLEEESPESQY